MNPGPSAPQADALSWLSYGPWHLLYYIFVFGELFIEGLVILLKMPPRIKILEALGAVSDGRVRVIDDYHAEVVSSEGDRVYKVFVDLSNRIADSNDNGTLYRGYVGYPIISFLIAKGALPSDERLAEALRGIKWRVLNETYKSYRVVEEIILREIEKKGVSRRDVEIYVNNVMRRLESLSLRKK